MAITTTDRKRYFLRGLKFDADDRGLSLYDVLKAAFRGKYQEASDGQLIISTSVNGQAFTFTTPQGTSPDECAVLLSELLNRFDDAKGYLVARGIESPTDDQIFSEMNRLLVPIRRLTHDYSALRMS